MHATLLGQPFMKVSLLACYTIGAAIHEGGVCSRVPVSGLGDHHPATCLQGLEGLGVLGGHAAPRALWAGRCSGSRQGRCGGAAGVREE